MAGQEAGTKDPFIDGGLCQVPNPECPLKPKEHPLQSLVDGATLSERKVEIIYVFYIH